MLHVDIHALGLDASDLSGTGLSGDKRIFRVVLEVSSGVRCSVDVDARSVDAGILLSVCKEAVIADRAAHVLGDLSVKACRQKVLRSIAGGGSAAGERGGDTLRPVLILGPGLGDRAHRCRRVVRLADDLGHLIECDLIQKIIPRVGPAVKFDGTVERHADELRQVQLAFLAEGRHGSGSVLLVLCVHLRDHVVRRGHLVGCLVLFLCDLRLRHGAFPVRTGQVDDAVGLAFPAVGIRMVQLVHDLISGHTLGENFIVLLRDRIGRRQPGTAFDVSALRCQNIVQRRMCAVSCGKIVLSGIQNVRPFACRIVCAQLGLRNRHPESHCFPGGNRLLVESDQLNGCLLDPVLLIIVRIRGLHEDLDDFPAFHVRIVGHVDGKYQIVSALLHLQIAIAEIAVGQAVSERKCHRGIIVERTGVPLSEDYILVAGLIIAVADIDAFLISHIILVVGRLEREAFLRRVRVARGMCVLQGR